MSKLEKELKSRPNADLVRERSNGTFDVEKMKRRFGIHLHGSRYHDLLELSKYTHKVKF